MGGRRKRAQTSDRCRDDQRAAHPEQHPHSFPSCRAPALPSSPVTQETRSSHTEWCAAAIRTAARGPARAWPRLRRGSSRRAGTPSTCVISTSAAAGLPSGAMTARPRPCRPRRWSAWTITPSALESMNETDERSRMTSAAVVPAPTSSLRRCPSERDAWRSSSPGEDGDRRTLLHRWLYMPRIAGLSSLHDSETFALRVKTVATAGRLLHRWTQRHIGLVCRKRFNRETGPFTRVCQAPRQKMWAKWQGPARNARQNTWADPGSSTGAGLRSHPCDG